MNRHDELAGLPADSDFNYATMLQKRGRVTIEFDPSDPSVKVTTDGFDFGSGNTCRTHCIKSMAWARDALAAQLLAERVSSYGSVTSVLGDPEMPSQPSP